LRRGERLAAFAAEDAIVARTGNDALATMLRQPASPQAVLDGVDARESDRSRRDAQRPMR